MCLLDRTEIEAELQSTTTSHAVLVFGPKPDGAGAHDTVHTLPADPAMCAEALYSMLREIDDRGFDRILVERPPDGIGWDAVQDRLQRGSVDVSTTRSAGGGSSGGSS